MIRPAVETVAILAFAACVLVQKWSQRYKHERSCYYSSTDGLQQPATRQGCPSERTPLARRTDPPGDLGASAENRCPRRAGRTDDRALGRRTTNEQERLVRPLPFQTGPGAGHP